eukprot:1159485-Pelagomonas_calceolata.AAC.5
MTPPPCVYKSSNEGDHPSLQLQIYIKPIGIGPTSAINRAVLAGILALQHGRTNIASHYSASCLSQIYRQVLNPMCMKTHLLGFADTSIGYYTSWQKLTHTVASNSTTDIAPRCPSPYLASPKLATPF